MGICELGVCEMNCPSCGSEMQPGFLQAGSLVAFNKRRHKLSLNPKDPEDVMIVRNTFAAADFAGYICKGCGLVVFDYKNVLTHW